MEEEQLFVAETFLLANKMSHFYHKSNKPLKARKICGIKNDWCLSLIIEPSGVARILVLGNTFGGRARSKIFKGFLKKIAERALF